MAPYHVLMVHFPIAFLLGASLFVILYLLFRRPTFEITSYYLLLLAGVTSPFAIATGLLTWWVNYRLSLTLLIRRKIQLSLVLLVFEMVLILWRSWVIPFRTHPIYVIMMLLLTPIVLLLGYFGGQMTFPPEQ